MSDKSSVSFSDVSLFTVVGIVFVVLKLLAVNPVAGWSWFWVLSPFWIAALISILLILAVVLFFILAAIFGKD